MGVLLLSLWLRYISYHRDGASCYLSDCLFYYPPVGRTPALFPWLSARPVSGRRPSSDWKMMVTATGQTSAGTSFLEKVTAWRYPSAGTYAAQTRNPPWISSSTLSTKPCSPPASLKSTASCRKASMSTGALFSYSGSQKSYTHHLLRRSHRRKRRRNRNQLLNTRKNCCTNISSKYQRFVQSSPETTTA